MAKTEAIKIRLEPEQKAWVKAEMVRANESEAVVIRRIIQEQINKCQSAEFLAIRERRNEKQKN